MIIGINRVQEHDGKQYHVQGEDLAGEDAFEVRVYEGGTILWKKRVGYEDLTARGLDRLAFEEELRSLMERTVHTVQAAISKGKIA